MFYLSIKLSECPDTYCFWIIILSSIYTSTRIDNSCITMSFSVLIAVNINWAFTSNFNYSTIRLAFFIEFSLSPNTPFILEPRNEITISFIKFWIEDYYRFFHSKESRFNLPIIFHVNLNLCFQCFKCLFCCKFIHHFFYIIFDKNQV